MVEGELVRLERSRRKEPCADKTVMDLECGGGDTGENIAQHCVRVCMHACGHTHMHGRTREWLSHWSSLD